MNSFRECIGSVDVLEKELVEMKAVLTTCQSPIVFSHNDLLCGNFIYSKEKGKYGNHDRYGKRAYLAFDLIYSYDQLTKTHNPVRALWLHFHWMDGKFFSVSN